MQKEYVILVDQNDNEVGQMEKLEAHRKGLLHRAFSVFVFNSENKLLIQKRARGKYHSGGLWANTCCSHPRPGETIIDAGKRRLKEEMGIETEPEHAFSFLYKSAFENGLTEHELDHVLIAYSDMLPEPEASEVMEWKYADVDFLSRDTVVNPSDYAVWFGEALNKLIDHLDTK